MIINHNISALNTHRQLNANNNAVSGSLEKLSSGLKINRAGDDAAGLAISEKMRGQIRGLEMATKNAQDGISLIQTAEGALNETHSILQRMRELAVQSSNDTNTDADRKEIQKEVDQLSQELSRISETTEFNTQNLLGGKFSGTFHIGANEGQNISLSIEDMSAKALGVAGDAKADYKLDVSITAGVKGADNTGDGGAAVSFDAGKYSIVEIADYAGTDLADADVEGTASSVTHVLVDSTGEAVGSSTDGLQFHATGDATVGKTGDGEDGTRAHFTVASGATEVEIPATGDATVTYSAALADTADLAPGKYTVAGSSGDFELLDGKDNVVAKSTDGQNWTIDGTTAITTETLAAGAELTIGASGIDVSSQEKADKAISTIQTALDSVSAERSKLGAYQNRLEHTINNLGASAENLTAAESRIRDVDMAQEMMEFTKNNILTQAAQAMLAQANQTPQGVLQLLR